MAEALAIHPRNLYETPSTRDATTPVVWRAYRKSNATWPSLIPSNYFFRVHRDIHGQSSI